MSTCPACGSASTAKLFEVTAGQASRSFVSPRQYPDSSRKLIHHLSLLWGRDTCDTRKCAECGFGFADPFVAGGAEFYNLAAPHPSYPTMKWEYARTIEELTASAPTEKRRSMSAPGLGIFSIASRTNSSPRPTFTRSTTTKQRNRRCNRKATRPFRSTFEGSLRSHQRGLRHHLHVSGVRAHGPGG